MGQRAQHRGTALSVVALVMSIGGCGARPGAAGTGPGATAAAAEPSVVVREEGEKSEGSVPVPEEEGEEEGAGAGEESETGTGTGTGERDGPAVRYAALDQRGCEAELGKRGVGFERVAEARGVVAPLRVKGPIAGVDFHSMLPAAQRGGSPYEIYDCRLVLALDDWARVLARHDVVEVVHYSVYRPPPKKAVLKGPGRRHSGGLAIDAAIFKTKDGRSISVEKDFHGRIGGKPCGGSAKAVASLPAQAITLRQIVCEAADARLFNVMLTPDYNRPHRNHFHLEITAGVRWVLVR